MATPKRELVQVNVRLFKDNVEELKRRAAESHESYHALIRKIVDEAVKSKSRVK